MKILPNKQYRNLQGAVDIAPACESSILKISEDRFAFCAEGQEHPHVVIESAIFALLMQRLEDRVVHYDVFRPRCLCCEGEGEIVIRLTETDGCVYQITEDDNIEMCMSIENLYNHHHEKN